MHPEVKVAVEAGIGGHAPYLSEGDRRAIVVLPRALVIETGGTPAKVEVIEKSWSEWVRFKFKLSMLQSITGIARFYVRQVEPHVEFYVSAVNFDPAAPMFPISSPPAYAKDLAGEIGLFSTLGMAEDHNGLNNGRLDEVAYLRYASIHKRFENADEFSDAINKLGHSVKPNALQRELFPAQEPANHGRV